MSGLGGRRQTLAPMSSSTANSRMSIAPSRIGSAKPASSSSQMASSIPVSVKSRMSIAPQSMSSRPQTAAGSSSSASGMASSMMSSRQSLAPSRRSSMYSRGNTSVMSVAPRQDPRPVGEKQWVADSINRLLGYLQSHGFNEVALDRKKLLAPMTRDFVAMFQFLVCGIDPTFSMTGKLEDDVPAVLSRLHYPFVINKRALQAVGTPHTWPILLAALVWLVEVNEAVETAEEHERVKALSGGDDMEDEGAGNKDDNGSAMFVEYLTHGYRYFMQAQNPTLSELESELARSFHDKNQAAQEAIEAEEEEQRKLVIRIAEAKSIFEKLQPLEVKHVDLTGDADKFNAYVQQLQEHTAMIRRKYQERQDVLDQTLAEIAKLDKERNDLVEVISKQQVSAADAQRMHAERSRLSESLAQLEQRRESVHYECSDLRGKSDDAVLKISEIVARYNRDVSTLLPKKKMSKMGVIADLFIAVCDSSKSSLLAVEEDHAESVVPTDLRQLRTELIRVRDLLEERVASMHVELQSSGERLQTLRDEMAAQEEKHGEQQLKLTKIESQLKSYQKAAETDVKKLVDEAEAVVEKAEIIRVDAEKQFEESCKAVSDASDRFHALRKKFEEEGGHLQEQLFRTLDALAVHKQFVQDHLEALVKRAHETRADLAEEEFNSSNSECAMMD